MSTRPRSPALHLVTAASTPPPSQRRKPTPKYRKPNPRTVLLRTLREQQRQIAGRSDFTRADAPDLYELAMAADAVRRGRRTVDFRGVRFPLKFGFRRYVIDPDTGQTLVGGGFLA